MTSDQVGGVRPSDGWRRWIHPLSSVRVRITLAAVLVTAVAVGTAGWLLVHSVEDAQLRDLRGDIDAHLDRVADRLAEGQDPPEAVRPTSASPSPGTVTVTDERGEVVATSPEPVDELEEDAERAQDNAPAPGDLSGGDDEETFVMPAIETLTRTVETPAGELTVRADAPVDQVARSIDALSERLVIGLPALVALVGVIAWVLVGRALRPVEAIGAEAERIRGSTMHRRVPEPPSHDEVARLARIMNTMLGRLETAATRQRRFVSDASHELRSPVAVIRAGLELARSRIGPGDVAAALDSLLAEESRLEALLDDLLLLAAHDENGASAPSGRPVNLTALVAAEARRPRRVPVELVRTPADDPPVAVAGSADQLARALSNLVDNAARHASSVLQIGVSRHHDTAHLVVDDDGPGIPPQDRERVFERFTRLDDSRARHNGGSGLGLGVVRSIVTRHHGDIRVDDSPLGGARLVVDLPQASIPPPSSSTGASPADIDAIEPTRRAEGHELGPSVRK